MDSYFHVLIHTLEHTVTDTLSMLPFLFIAFLVLESLEHHSRNLIGKTLSKTAKAGPLVGALLGCVPQCGFSVIASNLYSGGIITLGTLLAVFLSTSDEAVLILLAHPKQAGMIVPLLLTKVCVAVIAGYLANAIFRKRISTEKHIETLCEESHCGCHDHRGILRPALSHTIQLFMYIFVFTAILNLVIESFGLETVAVFLLEGSLLQPFLAALIGFIPNCAASVILTELYLSGTLSFASVVAGLCTNAGVGLIVLFRVNKNTRENLEITGLLYLVAALAGLVLSFFSI